MYLTTALMRKWAHGAMQTRGLVAEQANRRPTVDRLRAKVKSASRADETHKRRVDKVNLVMCVNRIAQRR
jgi:hypothetical protein